eukprot:COSAG01_NODE_51970_length_350_cov_0.828685_1_plen_67_part_10
MKSFVTTLIGRLTINACVLEFHMPAPAAKVPAGLKYFVSAGCVLLTRAATDFVFVFFAFVLLLMVAP